MINVSGLMDNAGITDWAYGVVEVYIDAYWDEHNDTIESIQVTEIIDDGSFESFWNLDSWNFGVVYYNRDAYIDIILDSGPVIDSEQATELWNNGSLVSDWNINVDDESHRYGVVKLYDAKYKIISIISMIIIITFK